jgi:hypothetical protein
MRSLYSRSFARGVAALYRAKAIYRRVVDFAAPLPRKRPAFMRITLARWKPHSRMKPILPEDHVALASAEEKRARRRDRNDNLAAWGAIGRVKAETKKPRAIRATRATRTAKAK